MLFATCTTRTSSYGPRMGGLKRGRSSAGRRDKLIEQQVDADPDELKREIEATAKEGTSSG